MIPSFLLKSFLSYANMYVIINAKIIIIVSITITFVVAIGVIVVVKPTMNSMLNIQLPTALPIAIPVFLLYAAVTLVISSGRDVPIDTIVNPTNVSDIPRLKAISFEASTTKSLPISMKAKPTIINNTIIMLDKCVVPTGMFLLSFLDLTIRSATYAIIPIRKIIPSILLI